MNFRLISARPERAVPNRSTVVPPSGTDWNERLSVKMKAPLAGGVCVEKLPENAVVSKPLPLTVPLRTTFKKVLPPKVEA